MNSSTLKSLALACLAGMIGGGLVYLVLQSTIARLMAENERLRAQLAESVNERDTALARASNATSSGVSEKDQTELLRLRGEVNRLRAQKDEMEKLRKVNDELTRALSKANRPDEGTGPDSEPDAERQVAIAQMNDAKQLVLGLLLFSEDHQQSIPGTLNQTSNYWGNASRLMTNQFELVLQRRFQELENASSVIAIRQKEAWLLKGNWVKVYGFADGHAELKRQPPEGFEAWEQLHIPSPAPR